MSYTTGLLGSFLACICASACTQDYAPAYDYNALTGDPSGTAGTLGVSAGNGSAGAAVGGSAGSVGAAGSGGASGSGAPSSKCDLSGRWLSTVHLVTSAVGQQQTAHNYMYYEIGTDEAGGFKLIKGLYCGNDAISGGSLAVKVSFEGARDAVREHVDVMGRTVTSTETAGGCDVHFSKLYATRGATLPYYLDPSIALPNAMQKADGSTPGWEDWDNDGNPGITGTLTGTVVGRIFTAPRTWDEPRGTVPDVTSTFTLPVMWDQEQNVMSYDPPTNFTLGSMSTRAGDPALHFADFARLAADQAVGDDKAICDAILQLAPTLTPIASAI